MATARGQVAGSNNTSNDNNNDNNQNISKKETQW